MRFLASRALSIGRQAFSQQPISFTQRATLTTIKTAPARIPTFKKHVSYKPDPQKKPINPNKNKKIPYKEVGTYLRYIIKRTPSLQIPVYRKWMSGGNRCIVIIKKVKGDHAKLVKDLSDDLDIKAEHIRLNPVTQHIEIKGDLYAETMKWILNVGF
ncbi:hypothetical protein NXS19_009874 [Fusarium pseudograminearum]|nr:hypothetical protein NXS19_009874 [Fusarium pseudograminearum]